uniref:Gsp_04 putative toxin n=1 Tax=Gemmula speciosa TaxID=439592 RepID=A0A098LXU9_GEMSP
MARLMFVGCLIFIVILRDMVAVCSPCIEEWDSCNEHTECCDGYCCKGTCADIVTCNPGGSGRRDMGRLLHSLRKRKMTTH